MPNFKTRARALDMLGRQQIAGIPTAISELFKNAHDAYADRVEVDFYRFRQLFILRDDGFGMTRQDFENRWLTLATESKIDNRAGTKAPLRYPGKELRPILGEKGIGRLAIGVIGPQVLIMSRALRDERAQDLVASFINWKIFEAPGVDLNDINVPVRTFGDGTLPGRNDLLGMIDDFRANLESLGQFIHDEHRRSLESDLNSFDLDPQEIDSYLLRMSLKGNGCGTHFYIRPTYDTLVADIDGSPSDDVAPPLTKVLVGFTNTMTPDHRPPVIRASFRDYKSVETYEDLIEEKEFWTPEEFRSADHHVEGLFDEYGQFSGRVTIYGQAPNEYTVPWPKAMGNRTECGPFRINFAYVQGVLKDSSLSPEIWNRMIAKLEKIGGLYIYRDGIRVLPYGNHDYDFLQIERNRTKSAYYYFFSYRRMFGAVEISHEMNPNLSEKAGREGFRENKAYRQFQEILKDFFVQIAADFFRDTGVYSDLYIEKKQELQRAELARRRRAALVSVKKKAFSNDLERVFSAMSEGRPQDEVTKLLSETRNELEAATNLNDPVDAGNAFIETETRARAKLEQVRTGYRVSKPRGIGLSKDMNRDWNAYLAEYERIDRDLFKPAVRTIDDTIGNMARQARLTIDRRRRIERALKELTADAKESTQSIRRDTEKTANDVKDQIIRLAKESIVEVDETIRTILSRFAAMDVSTMDESAIVIARDGLERQVLEVAERNKDNLDGVREQLQSINLTPDENGRLVNSLDATEDIEQRLLALEESTEADLELTQLGMAVGVINHEFDSTVKAIRNNLRRLKTWADLNQDLELLYRDIKGSFEHLDGYLTLFTPLQRRLYRNKVEISGAEIFQFLVDLFESRFKRHHVRLEQTPRFRHMNVNGFPSTFYPVFVNLVDNSIFWLSNRPEPRVITLDADGDAFVVADTGPGIPIRDREAVFELGFTRKPGGRGMGLNISRRTLKEAGYDLELDPFVPDQGAVFRIRPSMKNSEGDIQ